MTLRVCTRPCCWIVPRRCTRHSRCQGRGLYSGHAEDALRALLDPIGVFEYEPQPDGDLGQRMEGLMQWAFARGDERVVLVGSDSPSLPASYIDEGLALLREKEVVLVRAWTAATTWWGGAKGQAGYSKTWLGALGWFCARRWNAWGRRRSACCRLGTMWIRLKMLSSSRCIWRR